MENIYSLFYWLFVIYFISISVAFGKYKQYITTTFLGLSWKVILKWIIFAPLLIFVVILTLLYKINTHLLIRIMFPIIYASVVCSIFFISVNYTSTFLTEKLNFESAGYIILTFSSITYAHTPMFKKIYSGILEGFKKFANTEYTNEFIKNEKQRISGKLFSIHVYIMLFIIYFIFNLLNFMNIIDKDNYGFITESLLTFVIFDTLITYRRDISKNQ